MSIPPVCSSFYCPTSPRLFTSTDLCYYGRYFRNTKKKNRHLTYPQLCFLWQVNSLQKHVSSVLLCAITLDSTSLQHGTTSTRVIISVTLFTWTLMYCTCTTQHRYNIYVKKQNLSSAIWASTTTNNHCSLRDIHPHYCSNSSFASFLQGACIVCMSSQLWKNSVHYGSVSGET
jgi:hypothetical protein